MNAKSTPCDLTVRPVSPSTRCAPVKIPLAND